jgi:hypothetical protein
MLIVLFWAALVSIGKTRRTAAIRHDIYGPRAALFLFHLMLDACVHPFMM